MESIITHPKKKAQRINVLVDAHVEAEMGVKRYHQTIEQYAKDLERSCEEFISHCKDHRSLDGIQLTVERTYELRCSLCDRSWEIMSEFGIHYCANCGEEIVI